MTRSLAGNGWFAALALAGSVAAQMQWTRVATAAPAALAAEQLCSDAARGVMVLFGGIALPGSTPYHLLEWNGVQWTAPPPGAVQPTGRVGQAMAFDRARNCIVVFGGTCVGACTGGTGTFVLDETWEYDGSWRQASPQHSPTPRFGAALAYDAARARMVLYGGRSAAGTFLDETWEYDGIDWLRRSPAATPGVRGPMAYVPTLPAVAMVAGQATWAWDGIAWTALATATTPQFADALCWDPTRGRLVLYSPSYASVWEWAGAGTDWVARAEAAPQPDVSFALAWHDAAANAMWIGTLDLGTPTFRDTWTYEPQRRAAFQPYGSRCISLATTPDLRAHDRRLPWLGESFTIDVAGLSPDVPMALLVVATHAVPPTELTALGLPGCFQYVAVEDVHPMTVAAGVAQWTTMIPNDPSLLSFTFHVQAVVVDAHAPGGALSSNAAMAVLGTQ